MRRDRFGGQGKGRMEKITREPRILLYESEAIRIAKYARSSPGLEIGGDLLGFYEPAGSPLVFVASGPGPAAHRDTTHFQQDPQFQIAAFNKVASKFRMFYVGDWHSHHSLGLSEPSGSDDAKLQDLAEKNGWPLLYSLIVQTQVAEDRSGRRRHDGPVESLGLWWNGFQYTFGQPANARRRVSIEFQPGDNPYLSTSDDVNAVCEGVSNRWAHDSAGMGRVAHDPPASHAETRSGVAGDEFAVNVYQQICKIIAAELQKAEMQVDLDYPGGARLLISDGLNQVTCRVVESSEHIEVIVDSAAGKQTFNLPSRRGRIASTDIATMATQIITQLRSSAGEARSTWRG
jgi:hypothetical protein